jgi:hypothetical protein
VALKNQKNHICSLMGLATAPLDRWPARLPEKCNGADNQQR